MLHFWISPYGVVAGMVSWPGTVQAVTLAQSTIKSKLMILQKCFLEKFAVSHINNRGDLSHKHYFCMYQLLACERRCISSYHWFR